jgi:hypothetical protein
MHVMTIAALVATDALMGNGRAGRFPFGALYSTKLGVVALGFVWERASHRTAQGFVWERASHRTAQGFVWERASNRTAQGFVWERARAKNP